MATKIAASQNRLFKNVFVCKNCGQKMRTDSLKVIAKTVKCRRCSKHSFRPIKSKKK
jgi:DNA-directed RNA polymerase subunit RPC12/RpoP